MEQINRTITVITICYNCAADLEKTIKSVNAQSYRDHIEYIVVDGGSTDRTQSILQHYSSQIDICISEPDNGIYDAINKGVRHASGEWIICMNAGDIFFDEMVLQEIFRIDIPTDKTFIYSDCTVALPEGKMVNIPMDRHIGNIHHQNAIYRRNLHDTYGYYSTKQPYIVSDVLFFLAVPEEQFLKTVVHIAVSKYGGISCALWSTEGSLGAKLAYGILSFPEAVKLYLKARKDLFAQKIKRILE